MGDVDDGGAGYLKVEEEDLLSLAGWGLWGLKIRSGSMVGLSQSSGAGLLRNISSSGTPRLRSILT